MPGFLVVDQGRFLTSSREQKKILDRLLYDAEDAVVKYNKLVESSPASRASRALAAAQLVLAAQH